MSKFLNLLNKYSAILNEEENGVVGGEPDATNPEAGGEAPMGDTTGAEPDLGSTEEAIPEIGDQDLIDVAKILSEFINDNNYKNPDKQNLLNILKEIDNLNADNPDSSKKIKTTISNFVSAFKSKPSSIVSDDSTL
jgi:hypothetical protein